jgi:hypothetical protein
MIFSVAVSQSVKVCKHSPETAQRPSGESARELIGLSVTVVYTAGRGLTFGKELTRLPFATSQK